MYAQSSNNNGERTHATRAEHTRGRRKKQGIRRIWLGALTAGLRSDLHMQTKGLSTHSGMHSGNQRTLGTFTNTHKQTNAHTHPLSP